MITAAAISGSYRRWTPQEEARLEDVRARAVTRRQLAEEIGRSFKAVKRKLSP